MPDQLAEVPQMSRMRIAKRHTQPFTILPNLQHFLAVSTLLLTSAQTPQHAPMLQTSVALSYCASTLHFAFRKPKLLLSHPPYSEFV